MSDQNHTPSSQAPDPKAEPKTEPKAEPKSKAPSKAKGWFARLKALDANEALSSHLGLDLRSLAAFRIAMALLVLSDVYHRALNLEAHYTDVGFMPRDRLLGGWSQPLFYSFHNWGGDKTSQFILFAIAAVFAAMLLVGFIYAWRKGALEWE